MAMTSVEELEKDFWDKYSRLTPKQQRLFQEHVIKGVSQVESYKIAYDTKGMKQATIERLANRECNKVGFRTCKTAFDKLQAADSMAERREVERALYCRATLELDDVAYTDPDSGSPKMRTYANMTERGKKGAKFRLSSKHGLSIESDNAVAAATQLSRMKGWDAPVQVQHKGELSGRKIIRIIGGDDK